MENLQVSVDKNNLKYETEDKSIDSEDIYDSSKNAVSELQHSESSFLNKTFVQTPVSTETSHIPTKVVKTGKKKYQRLPNVASGLPGLILAHIFSFLSVRDLISVQAVCESWKSATMNTSVWKYSPLWVPFALQDLARIPYLYSIYGFVENGNKFFDTLVNNVLELREIHCTINDNFSAVNFQKCIKKFKNLECIGINNRVLAFVESLDILSSCSNLRKVRLLYDGSLENLSLVCKVIGHGFLALESLSLTCLCHSETSQCELSYLLKKKINQLTDISLSYKDVHPTVLELIFKNTKIKRFDIIINDWPEILLDFSNMTGLKSLTIRFDNSFPRFQTNSLLDVYKGILLPPNLTCLKIYFSQSSKAHTAIISKVISSTPHLRHLTVSNVDDNDVNQQLEKIISLSNLHTINFDHFSHLSTEGIEYVMKCSELQVLKFSDITFTDSTLESLKKCKYLSCLYLYTCVLNPGKLLSAILEMEYLTNIVMFDCYSFKSGVIEIFIDQDNMCEILKECRRNKHCVKIRCLNY